MTPEEVQRIAQTYLRPQNRVVGVYVPSDASVNPQEPTLIRTRSADI